MILKSCLWSLYTQINSFSSTYLLTELVQKSNLAGRNIVNAFLFLSGFFLLQSFDKKSEVDTYKFILNKFLRLWPVMAFSFLFVLPFGIFDKYNDTLNLFFINSGLGLTTKSSVNAASWFICVLFFLSIFFYYLMKTLSRKNLIFTCSIFTFWGFIILAHLNTLIFGVIETMLLWYFIQYSVFHVAKFKIDIYWSLIFVGVFFLFLFNIGFLSKFLNNKFSKMFGDFSYSIFVMHFPLIKICKKYFWDIFTPEISAILTFLICIIVGILTHILIEKNINKFIKKCYII